MEETETIKELWGQESKQNMGRSWTKAGVVGLVVEREVDSWERETESHLREVGKNPGRAVGGIRTGDFRVRFSLRYLEMSNEIVTEACP